MYNDSVIQEQSGLNAFYNKIYSLVGIGVGISALVSGLMMTVFQDFFVQILTTAPMVYYAAVVVELILVFVDVYKRQGFTNEGLSESQYAGEVWYNLVWENENLD